MTLEEIKALDRDVITPAQAAGALEAEADGCDSEGKPSILLCDPQTSQCTLQNELQ